MCFGQMFFFEAECRGFRTFSSEAFYGLQRTVRPFPNPILPEATPHHSCGGSPLLATRLYTLSLLTPLEARHHALCFATYSPLDSILCHYSPQSPPITPMLRHYSVRLVITRPPPEARHHSLCFATTLYDTPFTRRSPPLPPSQPEDHQPRPQR